MRRELTTCSIAFFFYTSVCHRMWGRFTLVPATAAAQIFSLALGFLTFGDFLYHLYNIRVDSKIPVDGFVVPTSGAISVSRLSLPSLIFSRQSSVRNFCLVYYENQLDGCVTPTFNLTCVCT